MSDEQSTGNYFEHDGYKIHYEKVGHGPCVVFMFPGACGNGRADLYPQLDGFDKNKFTLVAWDSPGFAKSRPPERDYQKHAEDKFFYEYDAETSVKLMTHLGYDSWHVMGWSDGGKSALLTPILYPAKIEKLVVWGTLAYIPDKYKDMWRILCTLEMWTEEKRNTYTKIYGDRETLERIWNKHMQYTYTTSDICKEKVKNIKCPTFVLHGKKDTMIPKEFYDHLVSNIPDVESYLFPDGVHDIHISHATQFNKMVQKFLLD